MADYITRTELADLFRLQARQWSAVPGDFAENMADALNDLAESARGLSSASERRDAEIIAKVLQAADRYRDTAPGGLPESEAGEALDQAVDAWREAGRPGLEA